MQDVSLRRILADDSMAQLQQSFDLALQYHQAGRLRDAEQLYRQILNQQPLHAGALHYLGVIAHQMGRNDRAVELIRQAIVLNPNWPEAHNNLAVALQANGQLEEAVAACRQAVVLRPNWPEAHCNIGNALREKGQLDEAIAAYRHALSLNPNLPDVHSNLGVALQATGQLDEAIAAFGRAIALNPNSPDAHSNLGNTLKDKGRLDEAIAAYRRAVALNPNLPEARYNLGDALSSKGQLDDAIAAYRQAIALRPNNPEAHCNLGNALKDKGSMDAAILAYRQAIALKPDYPEAHSSLGIALQAKGRLDEAVAAYRHAIALKPNYPQAHLNLGNGLKDQGRIDEAIAAYRQALALAGKPDFPEAHSNLVFSLHYHPVYDAAAIAQEQRLWNQQHAAPLAKYIQPHSNDRNPDRRLRIGYVSPDFRQHVVARFLLPLLAHHHHQHFEVFGYAQVPAADAMTQRLASHTDTWRSLVGLSDAQAADLIRQDGIDILVDLALHTAGHRLLVFARKPAPIQVTFAGYPGSTGLTAIDYRLSDPYLDPPGMDESVYSEQTIRLPDSFWCYDPDGEEIPINPLPALATSVVTFGCLNNFCKINPGLLALWAQVLRQVQNSRLLLLAPEGDHRQQTLDRLSQDGIGPGRVEFIGRQSRREYLELYHRIDLGLDTFPYNGHTTSLDSFWMGVPVVTLVGQTVVSRAGWCQLSNLGLPDLAGQTPEQFVQIAVNLAHDLPRLHELRSTLRPRMQASPLMDAPKFARSIEEAYRQMWRKWCATT